MPRYYRRRYTRVVRPKKKWASNITVWNGASNFTSPYVVTLVENKAQSSISTPTPTILKCGNFKITADMFLQYGGTATRNQAVICYILFVPEGIDDTNVYTLPLQHPEYIMGSKVMNSSPTTGSQIGFDALNMSTRLKRNLNSGDRVVLYFTIPTGEGGPDTARLTGNCRYWCCTN